MKFPLRAFIFHAVKRMFALSLALASKFSTRSRSWRTRKWANQTRQWQSRSIFAGKRRTHRRFTCPEVSSFYRTVKLKLPMPKEISSAETPAALV